MKNILKHKNKIIVRALIIAVLAFVYWWGVNSPSLRGFNPTETSALTENHLTAEEKMQLAEEIAKDKEVVFYEGESVFNVLLREMKKNKIYFEFVNTPIYNSAYIEGIANLYEFDCGELSGWMYKVNGWFPNYGCSRYALKQGDKVEWVYTCDLGNDVGGGAWQKDE